MFSIKFTNMRSDFSFPSLFVVILFDCTMAVQFKKKKENHVIHCGIAVKSIQFVS